MGKDATGGTLSMERQSVTAANQHLTNAKFEYWSLEFLWNLDPWILELPTPIASRIKHRASSPRKSLAPREACGVPGLFAYLAWFAVEKLRASVLKKRLRELC